MARTSTTRSGAAAGSSFASGTAYVPPTVPIRRRRPALIAFSVAVIAAGGAAGAALYMATGHRYAVLAVARPVAAGQVITDGDLAVADISSDPMLAPIAAASRQNVLGKRASVALVPGTLLVTADLSDTPLVGADAQTVGLALKPGQMPGGGLAAGQKVSIVYTPDPAAGTSTGGVPTAVPATIVRIGRPDDSGAVVVDVAVPTAQAAGLAAQTATGRIALIAATGSG